MEKRHFSLEMREDNRLTKVFQIIFGILCIAIAIYWLIYNFSSVSNDRTIWITVVFLVGFGGYLVWSGLGYAYRFIEFSSEMIRIRQNSFLPVKDIQANEIEKIDVYPLKVVIILKSSKRIMVRFGVSDYEKIENIKDELLKFAEAQLIANEIKNEM